MTWTPGTNDRITPDGVPDSGEPPWVLDEVVLTGVTVHLERMNDREYALMIHGPDGQRCYVDLIARRLPPGSRPRVRCLARLVDLDGFDGVRIDPQVWADEPHGGAA
jgi:hypothetical protein